MRAEMEKGRDGTDGETEMEEETKKEQAKVIKSELGQFNAIMTKMGGIIDGRLRSLRTTE